MKMKRIILYSILQINLIFSYSQINNKRIGIKLGVPNTIGLNVEYVTPLLNNKLAPTIDFTYLKGDGESLKTSLVYYELGANYYLFKEGKGPYTNIGIGQMVFKLKYSFLVSEKDPVKSNGTSEISQKLNIFNLRIGYKFGRRFYFKPQVGYGIMNVNDTYDIEVHFPDGSVEYHTIDNPMNSVTGLIFDVGLGIAF